MSQQVKKQKYSARRFLSQCKSLWYVLINRAVPCFTVIDCWVSLLHIVDDQTIIWLWLMSRCELWRGETRAVVWRSTAVNKIQHKLRNSARNLFIPANTTVSNSPQVTVHGGCLSSPQRHNRRLLCHHRRTTHTWKQQDDMESRETHTLLNPTWGQSCSQSASLHVRAVMRVQRVPSMLSVCAVNVSYCPAERWAGWSVRRRETEAYKDTEETRRGGGGAPTLNTHFSHW